jgi:hypothetical protein
MGERGESMSRRLGGNGSAPITMLRGEFNRKIKETYADGKIEGLALGNTQLKEAIGWCRRQLSQNETEGKEAVKAGVVSQDYLDASNDDLNIVMGILEEKKGGQK